MTAHRLSGASGNVAVRRMNIANLIRQSSIGGCRDTLAAIDPSAPATKSRGQHLRSLPTPASGPPSNYCVLDRLGTTVLPFPLELGGKGRG